MWYPHGNLQRRASTSMQGCSQKCELFKLLKLSHWRRPCFPKAFLAICGVAFLELGDGPSSSSSGDLLCMAAPLLMGLSWHLLGEHMRTFPQDTSFRIKWVEIMDLQEKRLSELMGLVLWYMVFFKMDWHVDAFHLPGCHSSSCHSTSNLDQVFLRRIPLPQWGMGVIFSLLGHWDCFPWQSVWIFNVKLWDRSGC